MLGAQAPWRATRWVVLLFLSGQCLWPDAGDVELTTSRARRARTAIALVGTAQITGQLLLLQGRLLVRLWAGRVGPERAELSPPRGPRAGAASLGRHATGRPRARAAPRGPRLLQGKTEGRRRLPSSRVDRRPRSCRCWRSVVVGASTKYLFFVRGVLHARNVTGGSVKPAGKIRDSPSAAIDVGGGWPMPARSRPAA
jgi:hypothetical protein